MSKVNKSDVLRLIQIRIELLQSKHEIQLYGKVYNKVIELESQIEVLENLCFDIENIELLTNKIK
jgi:hypothetical protein